MNCTLISFQLKNFQASEFHLAFESSAVIESIMEAGVKSGVIVELKE